MPEAQISDDAVAASAPIPPPSPSSAMGLMPALSVPQVPAAGLERQTDLSLPDPQKTEQKPMPAKIGLEGVGPNAQMINLDTGEPYEPEVHGKPSAPQIKPMGAKQGLVDQSNPYNLPPEAAQVIGVIRSAEGTSSKGGYFLYGGQPFVPGYEHPAREGWQGDIEKNTHAAGPGQWQPGTWDVEKKKAEALGINLDFGRGADQDWAMWDRAQSAYKNASGRDLISDIKTGKVDYHLLGAEWQGLASGSGSTTLRGQMTGMSPYLDERTRALEGEADRIREDGIRVGNDLMQRAEKLPPGSRDREAAIDDLRRHEREYRDKYEAVANHPPTMTPVDALNNFGSAGTIAALLGGLFAPRRHLTAALSAAGAAMQAINQNNHDKFQREYKIWEQQSTSAINMVKLYNEEIRGLLDDQKMAVDERNTRLQYAFQAWGNNRAYDQMALGAHERVLSDQISLERAEKQMQASANGFKTSRYWQLRAEGKSDQEAAELSGMGPQGSQTKDRAIDVKKAIDADVDKFKQDNPKATESEINDVRYQSRLKHEKEMGAATRQPRSAPAMALQQYIEEYTTKNGHPPGASEIQSFVASTAEKTSEGRTVGTRSANMEMATNAADAIIPLLEQMSDKIDRTEYPTINKMILAYEQGTGGTDVVRYGELINTMRYLYARALSPTGQARVADLTHFDEIMNAAWSKGQIKAGLDQIKQSLTAERGAIAKTRGEVRSGVPSTPQQSGELPRITSQDEYDKLSSGSSYLGPDGLERKKP